jgi:hypothetical protein
MAARLLSGDIRRQKISWSNTVAAQSKELTAFASSSAGIVGSNPTQGNVYEPLFCVYVFLGAGSDLAKSWSPSKESYRLKNGQDPTKGSRVIDR